MRMDRFHAAVQVRLCSADPAGALDRLNRAQVTLQEVLWEDEMHLRLSFRRRELATVRRIALRRGDEVELLACSGFVYVLKAMHRRKLLCGGLLAILLFSLWLPEHVLFAEVEGNGQISTAQILQTAADHGLAFGTARRQIRSEKIKNALLEAIPQLQWAGVNTYGCRAVISVQERRFLPQAAEKGTVGSVIAICDGVIAQMTVTKGEALCSPGQTVQAGQVLVSGHQDLGLCTKSLWAEAEIYADTERRLSAIVPCSYDKRMSVLAEGKKYSLIIGKKRINFSKDSGISGASCVKIYKERYLALPGGFKLPIALCCEQWYDYDTQPQELEQSAQRLSEFAAAYLPQQMVAGRVCNASEVFYPSGNYLVLEGIYRCHELIGITKPEE